MTRQTNIAGLILAAGLSRRMGARNKLLEPLEGKPVLLHVVDAVKHSRAGPIHVVTGHDRRLVEGLLSPLGVSCIYNASFKQGLSTSLRCGVESLGDDVLAVLVCLGDMPWVTPAVIDSMADAFASKQGREIVVPTWEGVRGHPVLFSRRFFPELMAVKGDAGGRTVIAAHPEQVLNLPVNEAGVLMDIDRPEDLSTK